MLTCPPELLPVICSVAALAFLAGETVVGACFAGGAALYAALLFADYRSLALRRRP